jgi:hypothetical protein
VLLFELFPAFFAVVALIVGIVLFTVNHRARNSPDDDEAPRAPSRPTVSDEEGAEQRGRGSNRPSMRA